MIADIAALNGVETRGKLRDIVAKRMTPSQIVKEQKRRAC